MRTLIKSSFLWQFGLGFAVGAAGLFALQPTEVGDGIPAPMAISQAAR